jgi:hypothetical protein
VSQPYITGCQTALGTALNCLTEAITRDEIAPHLMPLAESLRLTLIRDQAVIARIRQEEP